MNLSKKLFTTLNILLIFSFFFNLSQFSYSNKGESYTDFNSQIKKKLKALDYWNLTGAPIDIDDNNPSKNWEITVATYNWCRGAGTLQDPYIIENVTIDGQGVGSCIKISNSIEHFIIRNCTLLHSGSAFSVDAGIYLFDVYYGVLIENNCSLNANGILLENSDHNLISNNTTNENNNTGIHLSDSDNNDIVGNIISNNSNEGIKIRSSDRNNLSNNSVVSNGGSGIYLEYGNDNIISKNNASMNRNGISLTNSIYNNFSENTVQNNYQRGIYLEQSNRNNILQNNVCNNTIGISLIQSNYNNIIGNNFESNTLTNCEESLDCVDNYFKGNKGCPDTPGIFPPPEIVILIVIIVISVMLLTGLLVVKRKTAKKNLSIKQHKGEGSESKKFMEMSKTEADLEEEKHICVVHRGNIVGAMYLCPKCETYYCMKCAIALKNKGETCWVCNNKIELE